MSPKVLLTGSTGFIGAAVLAELIAKDYTVVAAIRSASKAEYIKAQHPDAVASGKLTFVIVLDITAPGAFDEAVKGAEYVVHVASPFVLNVSDNEKDLLVPAREGTLGVLRSIQKNAKDTVKQVVITASFASVFDGPVYILKGDRIYDESVWCKNTWEEAVKKDASYAYATSKLVAEQAAWDFQKAENAKFAITVLNPPFVFGPMYQQVTASTVNTSNQIIQGFNKTPENPDPEHSFIEVDVRDLAYAHVAALGNPKAENQRIIVSPGYFSYSSLIEIIKKYQAEGEAYAKGPDDSDELLKRERAIGGANLAKVKEVFPDLKFHSYKDTVVDTLRQLKELEAAA
ncbi:hypothetical protein BZA70DRAFT_281318 [Myxozyma melibiosi]|uniref:NAD-dependent epimerase/dehydratase domain-containing protein n=1 Tax=Myxozyma melibiosi TaxID=54550 RepID=A0ABR1F2F3_9ASCO